MEGGGRYKCSGSFRVWRTPPTGDRAGDRRGCDDQRLQCGRCEDRAGDHSPYGMCGCAHSRCEVKGDTRVLPDESRFRGCQLRSMWKESRGPPSPAAPGPAWNKAGWHGREENPGEGGFNWKVADFCHPKLGILPFTQKQQQCLFWFSAPSKVVLHKGLERLTFYLGNTLQEC